MISVEGLKVEFGIKPLFTDVSFVINQRDRIALVGKNGAGKSTMLKILAGIQKPTEGNVAIPNDCTIGYLPQVMVLQDNTTVREETRKAFSDVDKMKAKVDTLQKEMEQRTDYESDSYMELVERFTLAHERYMMMGAESREAEMERTLNGLGFLRSDFDRPTSEFSGGWRMRIELAKLLLRHNDVILLDEPTNHLDIESIQWLEQFLAQSSQAVVLVSHDRAFINNVTNRTLEISCARVIDYKVKYDEYIVLRKERREQQLRAYENQQKEIADTKAFIERFRYQATKAVQVQQRIRQLEKIVPIEIDDVDTSALRLKFPPCLRSGDYPVICEDVAKTYIQSPVQSTPTSAPIQSGSAHTSAPIQSGSAPTSAPVQSGSATLSHNVFHNVNLIIKRGEKVAFVGKNGEGKSTLVKCIMNEIDYEGTLKVGHNIQIGYFAQNQAQLLDESLTVFQTIDNVARGDIRLRINDILGAFMFGGEASEKYVKFLSGGERSRLAMIRLLLEPVNFLILDEPTNHLDMVSKDVLKDAIRAFDGTVIVVSHDREFLDGLVDKVYEFGGGIVREHLGGIYDYLRNKNAATINEALSTSTSSSPLSKPSSPLSKPSSPLSKPSSPLPVSCNALQENNATLATPTPSSGRRAEEKGSMSYEERKAEQKRLNKIAKQRKVLEDKIEKLEEKKAELDELLMKPENASNMQMVNEYTALQSQLEELEEQYFSLE